MIFGTSYFPTMDDARAYYCMMGGGVDRKLRSGEIHIGKPPLIDGEVAMLQPDQNGSHRWFIRAGKTDG
jgi:hypothetical protein